ncbi:MAG: hypothetical protein ACJ71W_17275 [Terriglobales bacterium]
MDDRIVYEPQMTDAAYEARQKQQLEAKGQVQREAAAQMRKLTQAYDALEGLMAQDPEVAQQVMERAITDKEFHWKLRKGLELADAAPRCRWVRQDGTTCGSPQMKKHIYCFAHKQMMEARALALRLPAAEDANAIQISVMRIQKALIDDTISAKKAGLLLYSLQLAITNIGQTTFGKADERDLATNLVDEEDALAEARGFPVIYTKDIDKASLYWTEPSTAKDAEPPEQAKTGLTGDPGGAKESRGLLPPINSDERGLETGLPLIHTDDSEEEAVSIQQSAVSQNLFTAKDAEAAKESRGLLPPISAHERGLEREDAASANLAEILGGPAWDQPTPKWDAVG